ncbi:amino acid/polyamine/organocation transporter (APC superfamily) [Scopulibacillus darangshiensis]|uniref:Amino acid/polyamine/organocation transporter (APC superfamily) n=1 Tax=Scopulibacillus darangshiensis TaxID=442528 RepID=A0A4R2NGB7_9BACL|nr:APC family permease [Scopulibacillus darangshiensis]TCP20331.1 amino acid/polyamine/organocation transporter (APC superfamily) [Scopulibacillus darangshiensis]
MWSKIKRILIGRPLKSNELQEQKLNKLKALAILSSDALSSVAYGPEQILIVLAAVSIAAFWYSLPIAVGVLVLLTALILSYRQIIQAYPHGGGAYMVAKENLGMNFGLIAGGSLLIDYILTVAVSVSAGTDAITSAFPLLHPYNVGIAVVLVAIITILNLRGLTESATVLAYPVYLFVLALGVLIIAGLFQVLTGHAPATAHTAIGTPVMGVGLFLLLKAFSSGCSALTGVEAISNAIPNFKDPAPKNAAATLVMMGSILALLFSGIVFLAYWYGIAPSAKETVLSHLGSLIFGRNIFYYFIQATTALILVLAANTGFSAFPLLAFNLAKDKFMPRPFTVRGDRLGYSNGIITLGVASIFLIVIFQGNTENLIPLYAVGVFIPFSLSQTGMIIKWIRERPKGWIPKLLANLAGALICYLILIIFFITKFQHVWFSIIFIPLVIFVFHKIHKHYLAVGDQLRVDLSNKLKDVDVADNVIIVPVAGVTQVVKQSLIYARSLSDNVIAVFVGSSEEAIDRMEEQWEQWDTDIRLVTLHSLYRSVLTPLSKFIDTVLYKTEKSGTTVTVVMPQFYTKKWWQSLLHNQSGVIIRAYLVRTKNIVIATVPYRFKK